MVDLSSEDDLENAVFGSWFSSFRNSVICDFKGTVSGSFF